MKKIIAVGLVAFVSVNAFADKKKIELVSHKMKSTGSQNMAGCGLGSMVVEDTSKWAQVAAAFLNGTGVQTSGITWGTSNCTEDGVAKASLEKNTFIESNFADIRHDISVGQGPYLSSLAAFYGVKGDSVAQFGSVLRTNQSKIEGSDAAHAASVIDQIVNNS